MSLFRYAICVTQDTKSELARSIGAILGRRRDQLALSNRQIALEAGVSHMTVKRAIDADTSVSVDTLAAICYALRLTPWRVLRDAEDSVSDQQPDATARSVRSPHDMLGLAASRHPLEDEPDMP